MAQEVEQVRKTEAKKGGSATATRQGQEREDAGSRSLLDQDLVDDYMSVPFLTTIHDILSRYDPRHNLYGIREQSTQLWALTVD